MRELEKINMYNSLLNQIGKERSQLEKQRSLLNGVSQLKEQKAETQKELRATNYQITVIECFIAHYRQELRKLERKEFNHHG